MNRLIRNDRPRANSVPGVQHAHHITDLTNTNHVTHHTTVTTGQSTNINDYCMGTPRKVGASSSGVVELYLCTQEEALFLPSVKKSRRGRSSRRSHRSRDHERYDAPPPEPAPYYDVPPPEDGLDREEGLEDEIDPAEFAGQHAEARISSASALAAQGDASAAEESTSSPNSPSTSLNLSRSASLSDSPTAQAQTPISPSSTSLRRVVLSRGLSREQTPVEPFEELSLAPRQSRGADSGPSNPFERPFSYHPASSDNPFQFPEDDAEDRVKTEAVADEAEAVNAEAEADVEADAEAEVEAEADTKAGTGKTRRNAAAFRTRDGSPAERFREESETSEGRTSEELTSEERTSEERTSEERTSEERTSEERTSEERTSEETQKTLVSPMQSLRGPGHMRAAASASSAPVSPLSARSNPLDQATLFDSAGSQPDSTPSVASPPTSRRVLTNSPPPLNSTPSPLGAPPSFSATHSPDAGSADAGSADAGSSSAGPSLQPGASADDDETPCSTLRGSVLLKVSKPTKIKEIGVRFFCASRTLWSLLSQGSVLGDATLPNNAQIEDSVYLSVHHWDFVPLEQFGSAQGGYDRATAGQSSTLIGQDLYGADVASFRSQPKEIVHRKYSRVYNSKACRVRGDIAHPVPVFAPLKSRPRKLKTASVASDGVLFPPGEYVYNFTLLVDQKTPSTVSAPNGDVKFVLAARVVRSGAFNLNVNGHMEVDVVRAPVDSGSEGLVVGPLNDSVLISRVWNNCFVYSLNLDRRTFTVDIATRMKLSVLPLAEHNVKLHKVQVYVLETITYIYSLDPSIRHVDTDLKLLLFQEDAPTATGNLLSPNHDSTTVTAELTIPSARNKHPRKAAKQPFQRGRYGEMRFIEPDSRGPYISIKHRLMLVLHVSRNSAVNESPSHYEVKVDTPITVLSRHCRHENVRLPLYDEGREEPEPELPPSFDDAMTHALLGPSGSDSLPKRGDKATV